MNTAKQVIQETLTALANDAEVATLQGTEYWAHHGPTYIMAAVRREAFERSTRHESRDQGRTLTVWFADGSAIVFRGVEFVDLAVAPSVTY